MINIYKRYQVGLKLSALYPIRKDGLCACGCGRELEGRKKRWATGECQENAVITFLIVKGDTSLIRKKLFELEKGYCRECGVHSNQWCADHIKPVFLGGSACGIDNFQTLCEDCHKVKTYIDSQRRAISSQAASISAHRLESDFGATSYELPKQSTDIQ